MELFKLIDDRNVRLSSPDEVVKTLRCGRQSGKEIWVYETHKARVTWFDGNRVTRVEWVRFGERSDDDSFVPKPELGEVPYYTINTDEAFAFKTSMMMDDHLLIEEGAPRDSVDVYLDHWQVKVVDTTGTVVAEGESFDCACAIIIATLSALISKRPSRNIFVVDC